MKIKQFLKPDWKKIVIFVVIIFLEILTPLISAIIYFPQRLVTIEEICCGSDLSEEAINYCISKNMTEEKCERREFTDIYFGTSELIIITTFVFVFLAFNYLLSCLIIWIYDKVKKK